ncbi:glycosyltransferase [Halolamina sp. C58]|uniref:glycosyltransferase n=1 Tax=Halolamina sp. C58 TaxID=3421640 RepID=UPI003EB896AA
MAAITPFELVLITIAVAFGTIWTAVNFYHLYPYLQYFVVAKLFGSDPDVYTRLPEDTDRTDLPSIDVLVPAYEEGNVIDQAIGSIRRANYPTELLRIHVLVEPDDEDTRAALASLADEYQFQEVAIPARYEEIVVPEMYPGMPNKPRALNYGFDVSDGDVVGVIDAEDVVDPDLFLTVANALSTEGYDYLQGKLDMVNEGDGWKNLLFRAEYAFWFRLLVPSFFYVGYPVPLGGTTNFFKRETLERASEIRVEEYGSPWTEEQQAWFAEHGLSGSVPWDPRNVTEDFELGILLWKEGFEMALIDSVTREESPLSVNGWIRQRTRWQKGKLYTFLQYLDYPPADRAAKFHGYFQSFLPHLAPINIVGIVVLTMIANSLDYDAPLVVWLVLTLGLVFLVEMFVFHAWGYWRVTERRSPVRELLTVVVLVTLFAYWLLLWGAEIRAIRQLYANQLHWEKTDHHGRNRSDEV